MEDWTVVVIGRRRREIAVAALLATTVGVIFEMEEGAHFEI